MAFEHGPEGGLHVSYARTHARIQEATKVWATLIQCYTRQRSPSGCLELQRSHTCLIKPPIIGATQEPWPPSIKERLQVNSTCSASPHVLDELHRPRRTESDVQSIADCVDRCHPIGVVIRTVNFGGLGSIFTLVGAHIALEAADIATGPKPCCVRDSRGLHCIASPAKSRAPPAAAVLPSPISSRRNEG